MEQAPTEYTSAKFPLGGGVYRCDTGERVSLQHYDVVSTRTTDTPQARIRCFGPYKPATSGHKMQWWRPSMYDLTQPHPSLAELCNPVSRPILKLENMRIRPKWFGWDYGLHDYPGGNETKIETITNPFGNTELMLRTMHPTDPTKGNDDTAYATSIGMEDKWSDGGYQADFGADRVHSALDKTKSHLIVFYFRINTPTADDSARVYFGCKNVNNLSDGSYNSNPYFIYPDLDTLEWGKWYMVSCYILAQGSNAADPELESMCGLWDMETKEKTQTLYTNRFVHKDGYDAVRMFLYNDQNGDADVTFAPPRVYAVDGTEPSLNYLLGVSRMQFGVEDFDYVSVTPTASSNTPSNIGNNDWAVYSSSADRWANATSPDPYTTTPKITLVTQTVNASDSTKVDLHIHFERAQLATSWITIGNDWVYLNNLTTAPSSTVVDGKVTRTVEAGSAKTIDFARESGVLHDSVTVTPVLNANNLVLYTVGHYLEYDLTSQQTVSRVDIQATPTSDGSVRWNHVNPYQVAWVGSNDGTSWTLIRERKFPNWRDSTSDAKDYFMVDTPIPRFRYYRLHITQLSSNGTHVSVSRVKLTRSGVLVDASAASLPANTWLKLEGKVGGVAEEVYYENASLSGYGIKKVYRAGHGLAIDYKAEVSATDKNWLLLEPTPWADGSLSSGHLHTTSPGRVPTTFQMP